MGMKTRKKTERTTMPVPKVIRRAAAQSAAEPATRSKKRSRTWTEEGYTPARSLADTLGHAALDATATKTLPKGWSGLTRKNVDGQMQRRRVTITVEDL